MNGFTLIHEEGGLFPPFCSLIIRVNEKVHTK